MFTARLIAVPCKIFNGAFSGDRVVEFELANKSSYRTLVPRFYCLHEDGVRIKEHEPITDEMKGLLLCKVVDFLPDGETILEVPDHKRVAVDTSMVRKIQPRDEELVPV